MSTKEIDATPTSTPFIEQTTEVSLFMLRHTDHENPISP